MTFITQPDTTAWNTEIADTAILVDLAETAVRNLTLVEPESQQAILRAIKDLPLRHLNIEDICACALAKSDTPFRMMQAGVSLLSQMPAARIPFAEIIAVAEEHGEDDDAAFVAEVIDLLVTHERFDDLRALFDAESDSDDDNVLAAAAREAVEEHDA